MDLQKIEHIIEMEWDMFQHTENIGGRASCQDDFETFYIMRRTQYESWRSDMVDLYETFAADCQNKGRNLVMEKYANMMQYTDLHYYNKHLKPYLPETPTESFPLINKIVKAMIAWEIEFAATYPKLAGAGRPITSDQDKYGFTSMETYARGELETYPVELLQLYADYVDQLQVEGKSLSVLNQEVMVKLYGYESIEAAEASLC